MTVTIILFSIVEIAKSITAVNVYLNKSFGWSELILTAAILVNRYCRCTSASAIFYFWILNVDSAKVIHGICKNNYVTLAEKSSECLNERCKATSYMYLVNQILSDYHLIREHYWESWSWYLHSFCPIFTS